MTSVTRFVSTVIIPRIIFIPYYMARLIIMPVAVISFLVPRDKKDQIEASLCIEAGVGGWNIIEYKELYQSAVEYLGEVSVHKVIISREKSYLEQVRYALDCVNPTHYAYSPRTGSQTWLMGLIQAFMIFFLLYRRGITPIVFLTDLPVRTWRAQSSIVTARSGIVVSLMSPRIIHTIFPHRRICGPYMMPFSMKTLSYLSELAADHESDALNNPLFTGSLYEPRTSTLEAIRDGLKPRGITFEIKGRQLGSPRFSDEDYWLRIISAPIIVTTADQMEHTIADWQWLQHFVYRYTEVLACGSLLVAPDLPSINRYFQPGIHYVSFASIPEAVEKISYYCENEAERTLIARQGKERVQALIYSRSFWLGIDIALGRESIT